MYRTKGLLIKTYHNRTIVITAYYQYPQMWNPRPNLENIIGIGDKGIVSIMYLSYNTILFFFYVYIYIMEELL